MKFNKKQDTYMVIYDYSLRLLSRFPKTSSQLTFKLQKKFPDADRDTISKVVLRLQELYILDDKKYAADYAKNLLVHKNRSPFEIKNKLRSKGIASITIEKTLKRLLNEIKLEDVVYKAAQKKLLLLSSFSDSKKRQKLYIFLYRKAFPVEIIRKVVSELAGWRV